MRDNMMLPLPESCHIRAPAHTCYPYRVERDSDVITPIEHSLQKSGVVQIIDRRRVSLRAKIYNNGLDHYMLLTSNRLVNAREKYVNLRHSRVESLSGGVIRITSNKDSEGQSLLVRICDESETSSWLSALTCDRHDSVVRSPASLRALPHLPVLSESDEEADCLD